MKTIRGKYAYGAVSVVLLCVLVLSILAAVTFGTVKIPFTDVYKTVLAKLFGGAEAYATGRLHDVVWLIRLPRLILAVGVGIILSTSGLAMQAVVKNPMADPYVLGVSSGAYVGATLSMLLGVGAALGQNATGIVAFIGAFCASLAVVFLSNIGGKPTSVKLVLAGVAVGAVCSAVSNFLLYTTTDRNSVQAVINWNMGSLAGANWPTNGAVIIVAVLGALFFWSQYRNLNLMLLGDDASMALGTDLRVWRVVYLLVSSMMVGFSVFSAGMIGFVGLTVPHAVRMLFGTDHKKLVPLCALTGAIFLVWADVLCRIVLPGKELPLGVLTSLIGAPTFIYIMVNRNRQMGGKRQ